MEAGLQERDQSLVFTFVVAVDVSFVCRPEFLHALDFPLLKVAFAIVSSFNGLDHSSHLGSDRVVRMDPPVVFFGIRPLTFLVRLEVIIELVLLVSGIESDCCGHSVGVTYREEWL